MKISFLVLFAIILRSNESTVKTWRDTDIEVLVSKDKTILERCYGAINLLNSLQKSNAIAPQIYQAELSKQLQLVSDFVNFKLTTLEEANEVFDFFISGEKPYTKASRTAGVMTFTNVLFIISIVAIVIAGVGILTCVFGPYFFNLSRNSKCIVGYILSFLIFLLAEYYSSVGVQSYIAFLSCLVFGVSYSYMVTQWSIYMGREFHRFLIIPLIIYGFIAIHFQSKLIGFIAVAVFEDFICYIIISNPWLQRFAYEPVYVCFIGSAFLVATYIIYLIALRQYLSFIAPYIDVFEIGILGIGTFACFTSLLILGSVFYRSRERFVYNIIAICFGMLSFFLGSLMPQLALFRGVASTFFVIYLMQKWFEVRWGALWAVGLLGGGVIIMLICVFIKTFPELFAYY